MASPVKRLRKGKGPEDLRTIATLPSKGKRTRRSRFSGPFLILFNVCRLFSEMISLSHCRKCFTFPHRFCYLLQIYVICWQ